MRLALWNAVGGHPRPRHEAGGVSRSRTVRVAPLMTSRVLILDYGSQYTQLIARRVREARVYSEIHPPTRSVEFIREWAPTGIILSGGPNSVYGENVPTAQSATLEIAPVLGVCYGMNLIAYLNGGDVAPANSRAYCRAGVYLCPHRGAVFLGFDEHEAFIAWMIHGVHMRSLPPGSLNVSRT